MEHTDTAKHVKLTEMIINKFADLPNVGLIEVWLQRIAAPLKVSHVFADPLTQAALNKIVNSKLWESGWLADDVIKAVDAADLSELTSELESEAISPTISKKEVEMFRSHHYDW